MNNERLFSDLSSSPKEIGGRYLKYSRNPRLLESIVHTNLLGYAVITVVLIKFEG